MADYVVTAATVIPGTTNSIQVYTAGAVITAGQYVYLDPVTNTVKVAVATAANSSKVLGIALNSALIIGAPVSVLYNGYVTLTSVAAMVSRSPIALSGAAAGNGAPVADLITNIASWFPCLIGIPVAATSLLVAPVFTGI